MGTDKYNRTNIMELLKAAINNHKAGNLEKAADLYIKALRTEPNNFDALHLLGVLNHQAGYSQKAVQLINRAINLIDNNADAFNHLGVAYRALGQASNADKCYRKAININPDFTEAYFNLGNALSDLKRFKEAEKFYKKAIKLKPDYVTALNNLATTQIELEQFSQAENTLRKIVSIKPNYVEAFINLGLLLNRQGHHSQAESVYKQALKASTNSPYIHFYLGNTLADLKRYNEAISSYKMALSLQPDYPDVYFEMGNALVKIQKIADSTIAYNHALTIKPDYYQAYCNLGSSLNKLGKNHEAVHNYKIALKINPSYEDACFNLANTLMDLGILNEAVTYFLRMLHLNPRHSDSYCNMGIALCELNKFVDAKNAFLKAIQLNPDDNIARAHLSILLQQICEWSPIHEICVGKLKAAIKTNKTSDIEPFIFLALPDTDASAQKNCAKQNVAEWPSAIEFDSTTRHDDRLHIGYLSADFRDHVVARHMQEIFEFHDRKHFKISAFSYGRDDNSKTLIRLKTAFDAFVDIQNLSLQDAAQIISQNSVDILIDLTGHTRNSRSPILGYRPAPVQVNFLGYPGTLGSDSTDYIIADNYIIPPEHEQHYCEKVIRLPGCYMPNESKLPRPNRPSRTECGLPEAGIVFCCFNQPYKILPNVFEIWCRLLTLVPNSVLWLRSFNSQAATNLRHEAVKRGISPERVIFDPFVSIEEHFAHLLCADIYLDTTPYNAHATCCDVLWAGIPLVTCVGNTFPSRVAGSILCSIGLSELTASNLDDYQSIALELATNSKKMLAVREKIKFNVNNSNLFNPEWFTRNLETIYSEIWNTHISRS